MMQKTINISRVFFFLIPFFMLTACEEDDERVSNDAIISLTVLDADNTSITEIIGDGETIITLKAKIPEDADDKFRKITFKTSKGQFLGTAANGTYEKTADYEGAAIAYLKVPMDHGPLYLSAEIGTNEKKYFAEQLITMIDVGQIISMEILDNNLNPINGVLRADGNTVLTLRSTVNVNTDVLNMIKFTNSGGTFLSVSNGNSTVNTDSNHQAIIQYKVPKTVGDIYFRAEASSNAGIFKNGNITLARAHADNIILEPSTLAIDSPDDQVTITTYLIRDNGYVSNGTTATYKAFQVNTSNTEIPVGRFTGLASAYTNDSGQITGVKFVPDTGDIDFAKPIFIRVFSDKDDGTQTPPANLTLN